MYFELHNEGNCYPLDYFIDRINDGEEKIELQVAKIVRGGGWYWCLVEGESGEVGDGNCGKNCADYKPRNGKNGRCCHSRNCYEPVGEILILTKEGLSND